MVSRLVPVACPLDCGGGCALLATVEDGRVTRIENNPEGGPRMAGCVRGLQRWRTLYAPDRLRKPLIRVGARGSGEFREAGWDEALSLVASRLRGVRERHGAGSIMRFPGTGAGNAALHNTSSLTSRFLRLFGGCTELVGGYSSAAHQYAAPFMLGTKNTGFDKGSLAYSKLIILWGANIVETRLEAETEVWIREARGRGVPVVAIDPRRTPTVKTLADRWITVQPGGDAAVMTAVLHELVTAGRVNREYLAKYANGWGEVEDLVMGRVDGAPRTPEWAEREAGTPASDIRWLADLYGRSRPAALIPGLSIQRTLGGEEAIRMAVTLQAATGNVGVRGGSSGGLAWGWFRGPRCGSLPVPKKQAGGFLSAVQWPDAVLEGPSGGFPEIKALYVVGANHIVQGSDLHKSVRAFESVEFSVCHDLFLTPTARYCDVVLPATTHLEREDILIPDGGNYLLYSAQAVEPVGGSRNDYDIFAELAERLGFGEAFTEGLTPRGWIERFLDESEVPDREEFKRSGVYRAPVQDAVAFSDFIEDPVAHPLATPSGRIQLSSEAFEAAGGSRVPRAWRLESDPAYPLRLVTPKSRYRIHSQNWNIPWFRERERHALWISPRDAEARGISDGDPVLIESREGRIRIPAMVTEDIAPGVVSLTEGAWPELDADGVDTAGSANILTSTTPTMPSRGNRTHSVLVQVSAV